MLPQTLRVGLLGSPTLIKGGQPLPLRIHKGVALLSYLIVTGGQASRATLCTLFWPDSTQAKARGSLRYTLSALKKWLGNQWFATHGDLITLTYADGFSADVIEFETLITDPDANEAQQKRAFALYSGDFMTDFSLADSVAFDNWQLFERERLHRLWAEQLENQINNLRTQKRYRDMLPYAHCWVESDPLHEPAYFVLIDAYLQLGKRSAAVEQYERCAATLWDELGIEPSAVLTNLYAQLQQAPVAVPQRPLTPPQFENNLPVPTTQFVNHPTLLKTIITHLQDEQTRLITLVGLGGIGKTRIAIETGYEQATAQDVCFVSLQDVHSAEGLLSTIISTLEYKCISPHKRAEQLYAHLATRRLLLILDNFEQLVEQGAVFVTQLLQSTRHVTVLITSRQRLRVQGETIIDVTGLSVPSGEASPNIIVTDYASMQLLLIRVQQLLPSFRWQLLPASEQKSVVQLCNLVGGMPLALELVAPWVRLLSWAEIVQEIQQSLDLLAAQQHDLMGKQQSVRAVFESSWRRLQPQEQQTLAMLSVFPQSFTRMAMQSVTEASLPTLLSLVDQSLVSVSDDRRYQLHPLLRQFSAEKLTDPHTAYQRHAAFYAHFAHEQTTLLAGATQQHTLTQIEREIGNLRAAWHWSVGTMDINNLCQMVDVLNAWHDIRGRYQEGAELYKAAIRQLPNQMRDLSAQQQQLASKVLANHGEFLYHVGSLESAETSLRQSVQLAFRTEDTKRIITSYSWLAITIYLRGRYAEAMQIIDEAMQMAEDAQASVYVIARLRLCACAVAQATGRFADATMHLDAARDIYESANFQWGLAWMYRYRGLSEFYMGNLPDSVRYLQRGLDLVRELKSDASIAVILNELGAVQEQLNQPQLALASYQESLQLSQQTFTPITIARVLAKLGNLAPDRQAARAQFREALQLALKINTEPLMSELLATIAKEPFHLLSEQQKHTAWQSIAQHPATPRHLQQQAIQFVTTFSPSPDADPKQNASDRQFSDTPHAGLTHIVNNLLQNF